MMNGDATARRVSQHVHPQLCWVLVESSLVTCLADGDAWVYVAQLGCYLLHSDRERVVQCFEAGGGRESSQQS